MKYSGLENISNELGFRNYSIGRIYPMVKELGELTGVIREKIEWLYEETKEKLLM